MCAAIVAALMVAFLSLGGASFVLAGQPGGGDHGNGHANGHDKGGQDQSAPAPEQSAPAPAPAPQSAPAPSGNGQTKSRGNSGGHGQGHAKHETAPASRPAPQQHSGGGSPKHVSAPAPSQQTAPATNGGGSHSTATAGPGNSSQGCDGTHHSDTGHGANQGGPYDNTCDGSPSGNGNGNGKATGKPCAGCVGNADDKNPKGQMPNGWDHNAGYECDRNHGIGRSNPAHTGCTQGEQTPPSTQPGGENEDKNPCPKFKGALAQAAVVALKAAAAAHPEVA